MISQEWWSLPGPSGFTTALTKELLAKGIVSAKCPSPLPNGIHDAIVARMAEEYVVDTLVFDASRISASQSPLHEMSRLRGVSGSSIGTVSDFLDNPDLADTAFIVHGIPADQVQSWSYLFRAVSSERLKNPPAAGPYLIVFPPTGLRADEEKRLVGHIKSKSWRGYVSSLDSYGWIAHKKIRVGSGIDERLALATSVEVAAWSVDLLEDFTKLDFEEQISPFGTLDILAGRKEWPYPSWENGLVDTWDDVPVAHAVAALAHGMTADIERRIWSAQSRVLLPMIDNARRGIIRAFMDELSRCASISSPYIKRIYDREIKITDPSNFEWFELITLLDNVIPSSSIKNMKSLKWVRDSLSHGKALSSENVNALCELWEQVLDVMVGPIAGWDWPRTGQTLRMTVGPSGAGKSTWASGQESTVVSSDAIREELFGTDNTPQGQGQVFRLARQRMAKVLRSGEDVILDATNIKTVDRKRVATSVPPDIAVEYVIIDRPLGEKLHTRGDRDERLIEDHQQTFDASLEECLVGDGLPNVRLVDLRQVSSK